MRVDLPTAQRSRSFSGLWLMHATLRDASRGFEKAMDRATRRHRGLEQLPAGITRQVIRNGLRSGYAPQSFGGSISHRQDLIHDPRLGWLRRLLAGTRMTAQHLGKGQALPQFLAKASKPFLDPANGAVERASQHGG